MLPQVHLIIDGYNVTKTGYGDLPLSDQRSRLVSGVGVLHAQTKAEVTVVFDGAELDAPVAVQAPREACGCCSALRARPPTTSSASSYAPNPADGRRGHLLRPGGV